MPAEPGERRAAAKGGGGVAPPPEQEHLPCPRCDSTNTKFCYYNNYNFSQPRYFCKSCRRYWTHGGTLRDIPVGGGTRKNAKRSRTLPPPPPPPPTSTITSAAAATTSACSPSVDPILVSHSSSPTGPFIGSDVYLKQAAGGGLGVVPSVAGSFTSLLNASAAAGSGGFLALGGLGLGIGQGFNDAGFGPLGRAMWAFPEVGYIGSNAGAVAGAGGAVTSSGGDGGNGAGAGGMNTWQLGSGGDQAGGGGFVGGYCFSSWPELAISTSGNGHK